MNVALSLAATALSLGFAGIVVGRYVRRGQPYQLVWAIALLIFGLATLCQCIAELRGWTPTLYRAWYSLGALLGAAYLGEGTIYLLAPRPVADASLVALLSVSAVGLLQVATRPVDLANAVTPAGVTGNGFSTSLLIFLVPLNLYGTIALVGGALGSALRFWRSGTMGRRALGTSLIAAGGLVVALGGTANRLGLPGVLYVTEMLGVGLIFVGYVPLSPRPSPTRGEGSRKYLQPTPLSPGGRGVGGEGDVSEG